jgi:hypothetical protein
MQYHRAAAEAGQRFFAAALEDMGCRRDEAGAGGSVARSAQSLLDCQAGFVARGEPAPALPYLQYINPHLYSERVSSAGRLPRAPLRLAGDGLCLSESLPTELETALAVFSLYSLLPLLLFLFSQGGG